MLNGCVMRLTAHSAIVAAAALSLAFSVGCNDKAVSEGKKPPAGLTRQQAALVLAKVGDNTITVGDLAAALERFGEIDRLRYQTPQKRKELLQELIDAELLAQEAKQRGIDKEPFVQDSIRQLLRDAMLLKARDGMRTLADIPAAEVTAYYEAHKNDYEDPERRRVSAIILGAPETVAEVLPKALKIGDSAQQWGELYFEHSLDAPKKRGPQAPADLAGDLGLVGPVGHPKGGNPRVPEAVQKVAFAMAKAGEIHGEPVKVGDKLYIVRLVSINAGHTRSIGEVDRSIRAAILQQEVRDREQKLEAELRKKFPVRVDDAALSAIDVSKGDPMFEQPAAAGSAKP
jgi:hypothetical protein